MSIGSIPTHSVHHHTPVQHLQAQTPLPKAKAPDADDAKPSAKPASASGTTASLGNRVNVHA